MHAQCRQAPWESNYEANDASYSAHTNNKPDLGQIYDHDDDDDDNDDDDDDYDDDDDDAHCNDCEHLF